MLSKLIVSASKEFQLEKAAELLKKLKVSNPHPDLLWVENEEGRLGVKDAKKIREHLSFKPHSAEGKVVVVVGADSFSLDGQNSLLKTLEEPPETASIILTANSTNDLLPTILSRCEVVEIQDKRHKTQDTTFEETVKKLFNSSLEERFTIIEKTEDREGLFDALVLYVTHALPENPKLLEFAKVLEEAAKWQKQQGNIRTILEYLMLNL